VGLKAISDWANDTRDSLMPTIRQRFLWPACNARRFYQQRPLSPLDSF
jgi:hypothetical protein